ncbi:hypothetical protein [Paenibacillus sp. GYB003]|uniref:hypothetical protein n=1 Tax=Paenibacillus sp. GYB003 TaxID=2994392 RepID=UPI002F9677A5
MQIAVKSKPMHVTEKQQRMIQFVKQNYKGLYSMSQWVANKNSSRTDRPQAAAPFFAAAGGLKAQCAFDLWNSRIR